NRIIPAVDRRAGQRGPRSGIRIPKFSCQDRKLVVVEPRAAAAPGDEDGSIGKNGGIWLPTRVCHRIGVAPYCVGIVQFDDLGCGGRWIVPPCDHDLSGGVRYSRAISTMRVEIGPYLLAPVPYSAEVQKMGRGLETSIESLTI